MNSEMSEDLHDDIDELAADVEETIKRGKEINQQFEGVFDPSYRRMEEADVEDVNIFS